MGKAATQPTPNIRRYIGRSVHLSYITHRHLTDGFGWGSFSCQCHQPSWMSRGNMPLHPGGRWQLWYYVRLCFVRQPHSLFFVLDAYNRDGTLNLWDGSNGNILIHYLRTASSSDTPVEASLQIVESHTRTISSVPRYYTVNDVKFFPNE